MKTPSDDLFLLIKSLSPSEKRYFRMSISTRENAKNNASYRLFDAIDAQKEYNEQALITKHAGEKFVRNFAMTKQYLQEMLLRTLCDYHASGSTITAIQEKITAAGILHGRGLYAMSKKLLQTARKQAEQHEYFLLAVMAIRFEIINLNPNTSPDPKAELYNLYSEQKRLMEIIIRDREHVFLQSLTLASYLEMPYARSSATDTARELLKHPLLQEECEPDIISLGARYHNTLSRCYFIIGDYENAFRHTKAEIDLIEKLPIRIQENYLYYLAQLHNFFSRCLKAKRYEELEPILHKIRAVPVTTQQVRKFHLESLFSLELNYYQLTGDYDRALALIPTIEKEDAALHAKVRKQHRFTLLFNVLTTYIYVGKYRPALTYANRILDMGPVIPQVYNMTRLLIIIIHTGLRDYDMLDAVIRSTYRNLKKQGHLFEVETIILRHLRRLGDIPDKQEQHTLLLQLRAELTRMLENAHEARALELFDFFSWIDAQIDGCTAAEKQKPAYIPPHPL